jgi:hypothetical protein
VPDRNAASWPAQLELGVAERALPGERRSGDRAVLAAYHGGALWRRSTGSGTATRRPTPPTPPRRSWRRDPARSPAG